LYLTYKIPCGFYRRLLHNSAVKENMGWRITAGVIALVLGAASAAHAHGEAPGHIYEGPSPGTLITIIMVAAWILIALGVVFFVWALIRRRTPNKEEETNKK
jgi:hypothetical protein